MVSSRAHRINQNMHNGSMSDTSSVFVKALTCVRKNASAREKTQLNHEGFPSILSNRVSMSSLVTSELSSSDRCWIRQASE